MVAGDNSGPPKDVDKDVPPRSSFSGPSAFAKVLHMTGHFEPLANEGAPVLQYNKMLQQSPPAEH